ncbi:MAG: hypothetical protein O3B65_07575 [Chloroflexi bacterium]|nr:hypothetical protein [Chloroflexota bacterium]
MIRHRLTTIALIATALALAACGGTTDGKAALPEGLAQATAPSGMINAYAYVHVSPPLTMTTEDFGDTVQTRSLGVEMIEVSVQDIGLFAARLMFTKRDQAEAVSRLEKSGPGSIGMSGRAWSDRTITFSRGTLTGDPLTSIRWPPDAVLVRDRFPTFWDDLQLAPTEPPAPPFVAGFVRNVGELLDALIASSGVAVPNLSDALALVRVGEITFIGYADDIATLPTNVESGVLQDLDASVLAIANSNYPAAVVGQVFEGFAGALGLEPIDVDGRTAHARALPPQIDLVVLREGATLFFAIAPTRAQTIALIASIP